MIKYMLVIKWKIGGIIVLNNYFKYQADPGRGKTFLVRYLIDRVGLSYDEVLFVAFMGKAASQLARNGLPAKTIHSAIYKYEK